MLIAVPVGVGVALFITQYAPRVALRPAASLVDLLAAVPSIVYGLWGVLTFRDAVSRRCEELPPGQARLVPALRHDRHLRRHDLLHRHRAGDHGPADRHRALARGLRPDAAWRTRRRALALGATRWEMIRTAVLPVRPPRRHQRRDAGPRPRPRRDHRRHVHRLHAGATAVRLVMVALQRRRDLRLARSPTTRPSSTRRRRPAPTSPPAWCCSSSPSSSTRSPESSSSAGRPSANDDHRLQARRRGSGDRLAGPGPSAPGAGRCATRSPASSCGLAFLLALIPLVWILCTVISQGRPPARSSRTWWTDIQRGITSRRRGRRRGPRHPGHPASRLRSPP